MESAAIGVTGRQQQAPFEYELCPYQPSEISLVPAWLIKVPRLVAVSWRALNKPTVVGTLENNELYLKAENAQSGNGNCIDKLVKRSGVVAPSLGVVSLDRNPNSSKAGNVIAVVKETTVFSSDVSDPYKQRLRKRHEHRDICKQRSTVEETRPHAGDESRGTLFQYYVGRQDNDSQIQRGELTTETSKGAKPKGRKLATLSEDEMKIKLFSMFDQAGEEGLILKQIVSITGQPQSFVKGVVNEIAEPRRRKSDKRMVLFIKDELNPNLGESMQKRPKFNH